VLDELVHKGLQSDVRFTETYIEGRLRKGNGPLRIRAELRERGIEDGLISTCLEAFAEQWREVLQQVHDSKFGQTVPDNRKELAKRARFLEYRGFPGELIGDFLLRKH
jgi:regulatory protein